VPHGLSQIKGAAQQEGHLQPPRRQGCSPQGWTQLGCFESAGDVGGALGKYGRRNESVRGHEERSCRGAQHNSRLT